MHVSHIIVCKERTSSHANSLAVLTGKDVEGPTLDEFAGPLLEYEVKLSSSFVSAVEKLPRNFQHLREDGSNSPPVRTSTSATDRGCSSTQERAHSGFAAWVTLWFYLCDHGEDTRKHTKTLPPRWRRRSVSGSQRWGSSRRAAPVSSGQYPAQQEGRSSSSSS